MVINLDKLRKGHWFEDNEGNVYDAMSDSFQTDKDYLTYHHIEPCVYTEEVDTYTCHPEYENEDNRFYQAMLHFKWFRNLMRKKYKNHKTFKPFFTTHTTFYGGQKCIVAMVNSGDYTLEEAIYVYCNSCERCMNVLEYKYLDGADGYAEFGEEWQKCNTVCDWCRDLGDGKSEG